MPLVRARSVARVVHSAVGALEAQERTQRRFEFGDAGGLSLQRIGGLLSL